LRVELNHQDRSALPEALRADNNDHRILAVAKNLSDEGADVSVVTKDLPLRLKASIAGMAAEEYRNEMAADASWTGLVEMDATSAMIDELFVERVLDSDEIRQLPCNAGVVLTAGTQSALGRVHEDKRLHLVRGD
ncbi:PIN domain-containing protein, partial [Acinetobacter baumannii]|uniref:PIN domain-containing protein n=1 Tax=Acinetobacter baumannii TaxID=470 RepID=UPI001D870103